MEMNMAGTSETSEYPQIVAEAEAAVSAMKDPELRRVAFEKILATLLEQNQNDTRVQHRRSKSQKKGKPSARTQSKVAGHARKGPKAYVEALIDDGYFKKQRTIAEVKAELVNRGHHIAITSLSGPLQKLTQERRLRRQKLSGNGEGKGTFAYSNW
jgi:hypothetical protein